MQLILSFIFFAGCEQDFHVSEGQIDELDFELSVLNETDLEAVVFEPGTDIRIAVKLINHSDNDLEWKHDYNCSLLNSPDFLRVYRRNAGTGRDPDHEPMGTPYKAPINCPTINLLPKFVSPEGESTIIEIPWSNNPDNKPLPVGSYL